MKLKISQKQKLLFQDIQDKTPVLCVEVTIEIIGLDDSLWHISTHPSPFVRYHGEVALHGFTESLTVEFGINNGG